MEEVIYCDCCEKDITADFSGFGGSGGNCTNCGNNLCAECAVEWNEFGECGKCSMERELQDWALRQEGKAM